MILCLRDRVLQALVGSKSTRTVLQVEMRNGLQLETFCETRMEAGLQAIKDLWVEVWLWIRNCERFYITKHCGYSKVILENDCLVAVEMINDCLGGALSKAIVRKIKDVARHFEAIKFQFVRMKDNLMRTGKSELVTLPMLVCVLLIFLVFISINNC